MISEALQSLRRELAVALLLAGLVALVGVAPARAAEVGAVADITWGQPRAAVDREVELLKAAGVRWVRANVNWEGLEPDRKGFISEHQLAQYDYAIDRARAAGLEVQMPIADGVPYWASADPSKYTDAGGRKHWRHTWAPSDMRDYGDIVAFVVRRFRAKGVRVYEIWNEPNHPRFWPSGPDPAAYVPMLQAGYRAAKAADPGATVLLGGLSKSDFEYLAGVYRAGGGGYFDAVAVHPYTYGVRPSTSWRGVNPGEDRNRISWNAFPAISEIKRTMDAHGDARKQVWINEFGYSTTSEDGGVTPARQAEFLTEAYRYVERFAWVHSLFWYSARNSPFSGDADEYEAQFGLMTTDWRLKPSYHALRAYAQSRPPGGGPTGGAAARLPRPSVRVVGGRRSKRRARGRGRRILVRGRASAGLAPGLRIGVRLQRRRPSGWVDSRHRRAAPIRRGRYRLTLSHARLARGRWRLRAEIEARAASLARPSRYRYFRR